jgi:hypothetical protein
MPTHPGLARKSILHRHGVKDDEKPCANAYWRAALISAGWIASPVLLPQLLRV